MSRSAHKVKEIPKKRLPSRGVGVKEVEPEEKDFNPAVIPVPQVIPEAEVEHVEEKPSPLFQQKPIMDLIYLYLQEMDERDLFTATEEVEKARVVQECGMNFGAEFEL